MKKFCLLVLTILISGPAFAQVQTEEAGFLPLREGRYSATNFETFPLRIFVWNDKETGHPEVASVQYDDQPCQEISEHLFQCESEESDLYLVCKVSDASIAVRHGTEWEHGLEAGGETLLLEEDPVALEWAAFPPAGGEWIYDDEGHAWFLED